VKAWVRSLLAHGWGRAALGTLILLLLLAVTGALATIFYRPYGPDVRAQLASGHWGLRVTMASGLHFVHLGAALALALAVVALVVLARPWHRPRVGPRRRQLLAILLGAAAFLTTGLVAPWDRLLPWSPAIGANLARPMSLGQQGPFAELVGVNMRYDEGRFTVLRRRFGPKATGRVYYTHVVVLPALTAIGVALALRRRRRDHDRVDAVPPSPDAPQ
jgi:hypothetical protein